MENNNVVEINKATLTQQVEAGMKKKELASHYGISELQMGKALKACGLTIKRFPPTFKIVDDSQDTTATAEVKDKPEVLVDNSPTNFQEDKAQNDASVDKVEENNAPAPQGENEPKDNWS